MDKKYILIGLVAYLLLFSKKSQAQTSTSSGSGSSGSGSSGSGSSGSGSNGSLPQQTFLSANGFYSVNCGDGCIDQSFMNVIPPAPMNYPRGIRNNNPLNIKLVISNNWIGRITPLLNTDQVFEQFVSYPYGIRASIYLLRKYINDYGANNINLIIDRWDAGGSNAGSYKTYLIQETGFGGLQTLSFDYNTMQTLVKAMANFENGTTNAITDQQFQSAWNLL